MPTRNKWFVRLLLPLVATWIAASGGDCEVDVDDDDDLEDVFKAVQESDASQTEFAMVSVFTDQLA